MNECKLLGAGHAEEVPGDPAIGGRHSEPWRHRQPRAEPRGGGRAMARGLLTRRGASHVNETVSLVSSIDSLSHSHLLLPRLESSIEGSRMTWSVSCQLSTHLASPHLSAHLPSPINAPHLTQQHALPHVWLDSSLLSIDPPSLRSTFAGAGAAELRGAAAVVGVCGGAGRTGNGRTWDGRTWAGRTRAGRAGAVRGSGCGVHYEQTVSDIRVTGRLRVPHGGDETAIIHVTLGCLHYSLR